MDLPVINRAPLLSTTARITLAAAALLLLSIGLWLIIKAARQRDQAQPVQVQQPTPQGTVQTPQPHEEMTTNSQPDKSPQVEEEQRAGQRGGGVVPEDRQVAGRTEREAAPPRKPTPEDVAPRGRTVALLLIPGTGTSGGGEITRLSLRDDDRRVNLQLPLVGEGDFRSYRATLQSDSGASRTWTISKTVVGEFGKYVLVTAPARVFTRTNYRLKLIGITPQGKTRDIATYGFQVERK